jgi:hypothetical protein
MITLSDGAVQIQRSEDSDFMRVQLRDLARFLSDVQEVARHAPAAQFEEPKP